MISPDSRREQESSIYRIVHSKRVQRTLLFGTALVVAAYTWANRPQNQDQIQDQEQNQIIRLICTPGHKADITTSSDMLFDHMDVDVDLSTIPVGQALVQWTSPKGIKLGGISIPTYAWPRTTYHMDPDIFSSDNEGMEMRLVENPDDAATEVRVIATRRLSFAECGLRPTGPSKGPFKQS